MHLASTVPLLSPSLFSTLVTADESSRLDISSSLASRLEAVNLSSSTVSEQPATTPPVSLNFEADDHDEGDLAMELHTKQGKPLASPTLDWGRETEAPHLLDGDMILGEPAALDCCNLTTTKTPPLTRQASNHSGTTVAESFPRAAVPQSKAMRGDRESETSTPFILWLTVGSFIVVVSLLPFCGIYCIAHVCKNLSRPPIYGIAGGTDRRSRWEGDAAAAADRNADVISIKP
uniref:Uncharacterized protein n=1 Tax=Vitrella brassicaformis TaxID=1169539 RepID=A0A7S1JXJ3_9ALVE